MNIRKILALSALFITATNHAQYTDVINSNRPGESQAAYALGKNVFQVEAGISGINEKHNLLNTETSGMFGDLNLRFGLLLEELELNAKLQYQGDMYTTALGTEDRNGIKRSSVGLKYLIYDPYKYYDDKVNVYSWKANHKFKWHQLIPAVSFYAGANFNLNNQFTNYKFDNSIGPKLAIITQNQFNHSFVLVMNLISDNITTSAPGYTYILTLTKGFSKRWSGFVENQGIKSDYYSDSILRGGAAFLISPSFQVDASVSTNFKDTPSILYGGVGMSWRYDRFYKPVEWKEKKKKGKGKDAKSYDSKKK